MSQHTELIASLRAESDELIKYQFSHTKEAMSCLQRLHDLSLEAADALQAMEPSELDKTADNNKVICPNCCHQFTAIPVNVQTRLQSLESVPMTYSQIFMINPKGYTVNEAFAFRRGIRAAEAHHGITPPESKG